MSICFEFIIRKVIDVLIFMYYVLFYLSIEWVVLSVLKYGFIICMIIIFVVWLFCLCEVFGRNFFFNKIVWIGKESG